MNEKKLYRSATDKKIFGVCGGLANYMGIDSTFIRIIAIVTLFAGSAGFWIYMIMALFLKYDPDYVVPDEGAQVKRLYRSRRNSRLFGVCGGIAEYFDTDATVLRVLTAVLAFCGLGLIFYVVAAIVMPIEPNP